MTEPPPSDIRIRPASPEDAEALAELGASTFTETFGHLYPPEDLECFLSTAHTKDVYERLLADPDIGIWLAVREPEPPIGYILVGSCKLPVPNLEPKAGEIRQIYVRATHQNARLGSKLLQTGLDWLIARGYSPLYVGVWSQNYGAQRLYARYGFEKVGDYGFHVGKTVDHEFIMRRR